MEAATSVEVRGAGFNLAVLQRFWRGHDFRDVHLTQSRCRVLLNYSQTRATEATTRLPFYFPVGGVSCRGCYWGIDLPAMEARASRPSPARARALHHPTCREPRLHRVLSRAPRQYGTRA